MSNKNTAILVLVLILSPIVLSLVALFFSLIVVGFQYLFAGETFKALVLLGIAGSWLASANKK